MELTVASIILYMQCQPVQWTWLIFSLKSCAMAIFRKTEDVWSCKKKSWPWEGLVVLNEQIKSRIYLCGLFTIGRIHSTRWQMHGAEVYRRIAFGSHTESIFLLLLWFYSFIFFSRLRSRPASAAVQYMIKCHNTWTNCKNK